MGVTFSNHQVLKTNAKVQHFQVDLVEEGPSSVVRALIFSFQCKRRLYVLYSSYKF